MKWRGFRDKVWQRILRAMTILTLLLGSQAPAVIGVQAQANAAPTSHLMLNVVDASSAGPIGQFKYIINVDNTGTTDQRSPSDGCNPGDPGYPGSCQWVSVAGTASSSPIFTQGDESDFGSGIDLPDGRYLVSVLADGYKIDGAHFSMPASGSVTVQMQPYDLPDATIQAAVFEDVAPTNSAPDVPAERGLAGFVGHIKDYIDEVTTDVYGDPLCGNSHCVSKCYVVDGGVDIGTVNPVDSAGRCPIAFTPAEDPLLNSTISQTLEGSPIPIGATVEGKLIIPNLGPNRYALSVVPPNNSGWVQTTTLEGNHDWDAWVMEGATGLDTEFVVAGEPFPATFFGYVKSKPAGTVAVGGGSGTINGLAVAVSAYIPPTGGIVGELGLLGAKPKDKNPIHSLYVSLSDLNNSDQTVFVGHYTCNEGAGCPAIPFNLTNVPDGDYVLGVWDEPQDYIFAEQNVSIRNGEHTDLGSISMLGWWTTIEGHVFNDLNENGKMDPGEPGIPNFSIVMRTRSNSIMDRGATAVTTDANGYYWMENAYPMTQWLVEEAYADGFKTTGVTYQTDNQPQETTVLGQGVDINVHPVIGLGGRLDWGVKAYDPGTNGGIVGTVSYDTTRNELDPSYAAIEDWQPSIPNLPVDLYAPVDCPYDNVHPCDENGFYQLEPDGSYSKGPLLNQYISETWQKPTGADSPPSGPNSASGCAARDVNGNALVHGVDENVLPVDPTAPCLEAPMMGLQFAPMASDVGTPDENFGATVDGNFGFGDGCFGPGGFDVNTGACADGSDPTPLPSNRDFLVQVAIPTESTVYGASAVHPTKPLYQVTREEDINVAAGDSFVPQVPPPACAGALHTVDLADSGADNYGPMVIPDPSGGGGQNINVPASSPVVNPPFVDMGGTVYEGQPKALCDIKLVHLSDRKSIAPGFNLFTDVPLPTRFWGLIVDDLNFSSNPQSLAYGEKLPVAFNSVGIYDYTNRLITTVESDYNGLFDVLLPSTNRISCPTPSGVCANLYRFVGNDPGVPGQWNANYNPQYRTISAEFEAFPGLTIPADLAPVPVAVAVQVPGVQTLAPIACTLDPIQPQLLAVSKPYANVTSAADTFSIDGFGFGATQGQVLLDNVALPTPSWADGHIDVTVPTGTAAGVHQLSIKASNGMSTVNGLTFHVFSGATATVSPFPVNASPLDDFTNRILLGSNWGSNGGGILVTNNPGTDNDYLRIRSGNGTSNAWWTAGAVPGNNQEAYFTFVKTSTLPSANEQGLLLKYSGGSSPTSNNARWIEVAVDNNNSTDPEGGTVRVRTKSGTGPAGNQIVEQLNINTPDAVFSNGDQLGARALSNGTIIVYKNGSEIGRVTVNTTGGWTGRIGVRFEGSGNAGTTEARIDNFGGGDVTLTTNSGSQPSLFEVGPGHPYGTIQIAINAAAAQNPYKDSLVVVYPGATAGNPRYNGRGAYLENPIMYAPVKLQGVGPGGVRPDHSIVQGSIIDGSAFGGDTTLATNWLGKVSSLTWDGNQDINDGQVIYVLASNTGSPTINRAGSFSSTTYKASIDGFDIRGGDQQGLPGNLNAIFGGFPGPLEALQVTTQGGAIFANSYVRNLQVTNNVIESNGGSYGAIRIGTPSLPGTQADQQNDNLKIANNRILANGGTNLAGAIGIFNGAENYEIARNDICGNFSAEYGGAISHFGRSPNGKIHDNRIYFNHSYDEGAGIMIAGELPASPTANYGTPNGPQGSGPVDIYNNLIQANLSEDDGGGLRFLMAGNFPMNVYNNMIVNNVSTHEGGGVALDDAPNVRFYNNTVMNNKTTATAVTSNGSPEPAGLSTGQNSAQLQATLPGGSPIFSNPLLFNNIFWDNRAGSRGINTVLGISSGDANPWDIGVIGGVGSLAPTNSIIQQNSGTYPYTTSPTNASVNPAVLSTYDVGLSFTSWRTNVNFIGAIMVTADLPPNLLGNYHIPAASPAYNTGAASKAVPAYQQAPTTLNAPAFDIDNDGRPGFGSFDKGADEVPATTDLGITKTDNVTSVSAGGALTYTIVVSNSGPNAATGATVTDTFPASLSVSSWTCAASAGSSCTATGSGNNRGGSVTLAVGGTATYTANATVSNNASGSVTNTASVTPPAGLTNSNTTNNSATDTDTVLLSANLSITKTDNVGGVSAGGILTYTLAVGNSGPNNATGALVTDTFLPAVFTNVTWTCSASGGSSCGSPTSGSGDINRAVNVQNGGTVTFTVQATVSASATGSFTNTATVAAPVGITDPNLANNTANDSDAIVASNPAPTLAVLDSFNRANANTLGGNWSQVTLFGRAAIRVNSNQANVPGLPGWAIWNVPSGGFGAQQGTAFTFANTPSNGSALILKGSGGSANTPANYIRVEYQSGQLQVSTTTNAGGTLLRRAAFTVSFATNDTLTATNYANGNIYVYKNGTFVGAVYIPTSGPDAWAPMGSAGRIGILLPNGARVRRLPWRDIAIIDQCAAGGWMTQIHLQPPLKRRCYE